ncbi:Choline dehydrogenase, mitochondrial [Mycena sanguinolenta]|uniref:Choline dehydrogenase, mitochondrial n=1 Tax=Mycena sanguinolenta TaxID=230812 RepID=A0A8H6ZDM0_9AGAR|nr:Choline dehydrogenase, mitochondrial [Mycena sanguinolenta]
MLARYSTPSERPACPLRAPAFGVVDPDLVVKGISGLRIADASILPIVPSAHTQVPTYIVGERAADLVKATYGLNDVIVPCSFTDQSNGI